MYIYRIFLSGKMFKLLLTTSAFMIMSAHLVFAQQKAPKTIPASYYIEKNELQLSEAINKLRVKKGLGELQLSPSLSFVARTHLNDIRLNSKNQHGCNLNSWSDKGKWTPCCFNAKQKNLDLMNSKPSEIIGFRGKGFEIVVALKKEVTGNDINDLWLNATSTHEFLLNTGPWTNRNWQSMGISIYKGYASIWLSELPDRITEIPLKKDANTKLLAQNTLPTVKTTKPTVTVPETKTKAPLTRGSGSQLSIPSTESVPEEIVQTYSVLKPSQTEAAKSVQSPDKATNYYLVHSSYTSLSDAMKTIETLKGEGFPNLVMIDARGKYRVALGIYTTEAAAKTALRKNYPRFDQLKIFVF